ncbi:TlpA family protein disulfide reductase [Acidiferrimicrobium sp. IK]|uniref:TlpA family protein disulfide reductase n=1 Tax=Acidiferrimicrobium sp. IK TaxID=2871700 RepID=UPI0021CB0FA8|nr:TlpA disulfide reductase family protein [Acidiferrimicrobium sp. IK]MCU4186691.1 TlpA family protein disulfide reductase [Acidiferrimicrobium sp. IK]
MSAEMAGDYLTYRMASGRGRTRVLRVGVAAGLVAAAAAAWVAVATTGGGASGAAVAAGSLPRVSDFSLASVRPGQPSVSLSAEAGRPVVLSFFASWCDGCQAELKAMRQVVATAPKNVAVIGVDVNDSSAAARSLLAADHLTYPVGADTAGNVASSAGLVGLPTTLFFNASHKAIGQVVGPLTPAAAAPWLRRIG